MAQRMTKENFLITGLVCIVFGGFLTVGGVWAMGFTVGLFGVVFFVVGMTVNRQASLTPAEVAAWSPEQAPLPDAGRFMYRVDVTLDDPVRSSILCGPCGHLEVVSGPRPPSYRCVACDRALWDEEE